MGKLFSGAKPQAAPVIEDVDPLPVPDGEQSAAAQRRRTARAQRSSGVLSTVLTRPSGRETLGG